ncbi:unnamed protein product [Closterium sp. Naga37s-1]|nr:unnamed protein product [Closterium sp. Naga37s-1]
MNLSGSFTSCYVATGSFSRTAVNILAGAHTALTQIILSFTMLIVLLAAAPAFKYVPACVVGAVIANSVLNLLDFKAAFQIWRVNTLNFILMLACFHRPLSPGFPSHLSPSSPPFSAGLQGSVYDLEGRQTRFHGHARLLPTPIPPIDLNPFSVLSPHQLDFKAAFTIWRVDKLDFMVMLGCFLGIIFGSPEIGLLVASVLSVLKLLLRIVRPHIRLLGLLPGGAATSRERATVPQQHAVRGDRDAED